MNIHKEVIVINAPRTKLIETRKKRGFTQEQLAEKVGIARTYLSNIESGRYTPSLEVAKNISATLKISIDKLFL